ncbi:hypothetical protein H6501_04390 [Candidatus Woesearchaeota archaeon]|nr:hypothetical protein [Nanoarchaeota archaeon]MCB9370810.1 hypothetical protein [Candidatus Woesearchaeota archaeon]USN43910.1 MAG: hypothetical protein H6500_05990 [Candidatus Woesearchaeota archaeon]
MVIDIDSFLAKYAKDEDVYEEEERAGVSLEFQQEVERRVQSKIEEGMEAQDLQILRDVYEEIKHFDEDLPNKFLALSGSGEKALKEVGNRYTNEYFQTLSQIVAQSEQYTLTLFASLDKVILTNDFTSIMNFFNDLLKQYHLFPREFLTQKITLANNIRERQLVIEGRLEQYKNKEVIRVKSRIRELAEELKKHMANHDPLMMEQTIEQLHHLINKVPKVFLSELHSEKVAVIKLLTKAQAYLEREYHNDFEQKEKEMQNLFSLFHEYYLAKNLGKTLLVYDQIIHLFRDLPEVFLQRKIGIYQQINTIFESVNKLQVQHSVDLFLQSYTASKAIERIREYLLYVQRVNKADPKILAEIEQKLKVLPRQYHDEKAELGARILQIKNRFPSSSHTKQINLQQVPTSKPTLNTDSKKPSLEKEGSPSNQKIRDVQEGQSQNTQFFKNDLRESQEKQVERIKHYFQELKEKTNPVELREVYQKFLLSVKLLRQSSEKKQQLIAKAKQIISEKRLG